MPSLTSATETTMVYQDKLARRAWINTTLYTQYLRLGEDDDTAHELVLGSQQPAIEGWSNYMPQLLLEGDGRRNGLVVSASSTKFSTSRVICGNVSV